jgi:hypothetical protein
MFVCSGTAGKSPWRIHRIDASSKATLFAEIAEGLLLNGFTPFFGHSALVADSYLGAVFQIDLVDGSANTWFQHSDWESRQIVPPFLGLTVSSASNRAFMLRTPIAPDLSRSKWDQVGRQKHPPSQNTISSAMTSHSIEAATFM